MNKRKLFSPIISLLLATLLVLGLITPVLALPAEEENLNVSWKQIENESAEVSLPRRQLVTKDSSNIKFTEFDVVRVSIILEDEPTLEAGFSAEDIAKSNKQALNYRSDLESQQNALSNKISAIALDGEELDVVWNLTLVENAISANVPFGAIDLIKNIKGVNDVVIETQYFPCVYSVGGDNPNMATSSNMIGSSSAWASGYTGAGSRVAIIDTGIDTDHQSFNSEAYIYSLQQNAKILGIDYAQYKQSLNLLTKEEVAAKWNELNISKRYQGASSNTFFGDKLPFAINYVDNDTDVTHDHDTMTEHGSHVAGIAAANSFIPAGDNKFTSALETVKTQGVAPDAQIITMKVFGKKGGAYDSDYMVAIEDAVVLGADSINLSIGSANAGSSTATEASYQKIMDALANSNAVVSTSAGNSGSWADNTLYGHLYSDGVNLDTLGSPASFTNAFAVASADNDGATGNYFKIGEDNIFYTPGHDADIPSLSTLTGTHDYIYINSVGKAAEFNALQEIVQGKIAICNRGETSFIDKATAAAKAGAIACIIVNNQPGTVGMTLAGFEGHIPCVSVAQSVGDLLKNESLAEYHQDGNYYLGKIEITDDIKSLSYNSDYYKMSSFSSVGIPESLTLKPEITAPGGNIYSVNGLDTSGKAYEVMSGTSMAAPQIAGMSAIVAQYIRNNNLSSLTGLTARQLTQSLLMSTATPVINESNNYYYSILQQGAGLANVDNAIKTGSYILMNDDATASAADGKIKAELGDDPERTGKYNFSFTLHNITSQEKTFALSSEFFTQNYFTEESDTFMDLQTVPLSANVEWHANGKKLKAEQSSEISACDFDDDNYITEADGQALLDYLVGSRTTIANINKADLDKDGDVDTHDAYCFFQNFGVSVVKLPANGSVNISVSAEITNISNYDDCGAYVEGYVFANEFTSKEGVAGDSHSIPVLAYYGGWDESSMFDVGSYIEYMHNTESRIPYMYAAFGNSAYYDNTYCVRHAEDGKDYYFGGNPVKLDEVYLPERNAINGENGDCISNIFISTVRNAKASQFSVTTEDGTIISSKSFGSVDCAFYNDDDAAWEQAEIPLALQYHPTGLEEDTRINLKLSLAPEYYVDADGLVDWNNLNEAASLSVPAVIDNTVPEILDVRYASWFTPKISGLRIQAKDNQYIAAMALFNDSGKLIQVLGSDATAKAGNKMTRFFDLTKNTDTKFLLQVYDYAYNYSSYKINLDPADSNKDISVTLNKSELNILLNTSSKLTATVGPWGTLDESVSWASDNTDVATVDENGIVTGRSAGTAIITATSNADTTKSDSCSVTVSTLPVTLSGIIQDENNNTCPFTWDLKNDNTLTKNDPLEISGIVSYACDQVDNNYAFAQDALGYWYTIDTGNWTVTNKSEKPLEACLDDFAIAQANSANSVSGESIVFGVYAGYVIKIVNGQIDGLWNIGPTLSSYGGKWFTTIAWSGVANGYDVFVALDDNGTMWVVQTTDEEQSIKIGIIPGDLNLLWPGFYYYMFCSMVMGEDDNFYLSYFTGEANNNCEVYQLAIDSENHKYTSRIVASFDDGMWPCHLGTVKNSSANMLNAFNSNASNTALKNNFEEIAILQCEDVSIKSLLKDATPHGSQNSVSSSLEKNKGEKYYDLTISANDAKGANIASNNGRIKVDYNKASLELTSVQVFADHSSVNGSSIAYVDMNGISAGQPFAKLRFKVLNNADTLVRVQFLEINNEEKCQSKEIRLREVVPHGGGGGNASAPATKKDTIIATKIEKASDAVKSIFFKDLNQQFWYMPAVNFCLENGLIFGLSKDSFGPTANTTRGQMVYMLYQASEKAEIGGAKFSDVASDKFYAYAAAWAKETGLAKGTEDGLFGGEDFITREQFATFIYRYAVLSGRDTSKRNDLKGFPDGANVRDYARDAIEWAVAEGIINGKDGKLDASCNISRAEACQMIYKMFWPRY